MSEQKRPEAGEWWQLGGHRVRIVGHRSDGMPITEDANGFIGCIENQDRWQHVLGCDSFEWQPKPNYVRLWTHRTSGTVCSATDERYLKYPDIWTELKHDGTGFVLSDGEK